MRLQVKVPNGFSQKTFRSFSSAFKTASWSMLLCCLEGGQRPYRGRRLLTSERGFVKLPDVTMDERWQITNPLLGDVTNSEWLTYLFVTFYNQKYTFIFISTAIFFISEKEIF